MIIDNREFLAYLGQLKRAQKLKVAVNIIRSYVNNMARATQEQGARNIDKEFKFKNPSTKKFMTKGVYYEKAKAGQPGNPTSEVGAVGNPRAMEYKQHRSEILARQELGGAAEQIKSGRARMRKALIAPDPRHNKNKFSPRLKSRVATPKVGTKETKPGRIHAATIRHARITKKPYAITPYGLFRVFSDQRVTGGARRRIERISVWKPKIKTTAAPWLMPAAKEAMRNREKYFREAYLFRMSKALGGRQNGVMA